MAQGANLAPDASANAVDEQLGTLCRRWLTCAENVVRAYERHGAQGSASADLLRLYQQGLQDACSAFIEFSESTSWHLAPEPSHADNAFTSQARTVSPDTWWQIIDAGLLRQTASALECVRVPHLTTGLGRDDTDLPQRHVLRVGTFHETVLIACSIVIQGVSLAPIELWRPLLEQLLEPRANGFILLLTDVLGALCQVAPDSPLLFRAQDDPTPRTHTNNTNTLRNRMSVRLAPGTLTHPHDITETHDTRASKSTGGVGPTHTPPAFTGFAPSPAKSGVVNTDLFTKPSSVGVKQGTKDASVPTHTDKGEKDSGRAGKLGPEPSFSTGSDLNLNLDVNLLPGLVSVECVSEVAPVGQPAHAATSPAAPVPQLRLDRIASVGGAAAKGPAHTRATVGGAAPAATPASPGDGTHTGAPYVSRRAALTALRVLRDVNELGSLEMSVRRGSASLVSGLPTIRRFLESLVDLRTGIAAALNHLRVLGHLATMYKTSEEICMSREELFPVLEGIVAVACHASSPDLPGPGKGGRQGQQTGDVRLYASALQPDVLSLLTDELHQTVSGVSAQVRARSGETFHSLPLQLQSRLSLLRHISECLIVFGAAPLPAHTAPHASDVLAAERRAGRDTPSAGAVGSPGGGVSPRGGEAVGRVGRTLSRRSVLRSASRSTLKLRNSLGEDGGVDSGATASVSNNSNTQSDISPLLKLVKDVIATVRLFTSFAASDVPFFCTAADCWLPTVKVLVRRLACEGHVDLVEMLTLTLCEVSAAMTTAMSVCGAEAAHADATAQTRITERLQKQMAGGLLLDHSVEAEVYRRVGNRRGHPNRPFGWGAGAKATGLHFGAITDIHPSEPTDTTLTSPRNGQPLMFSEPSPRQALDSARSRRSSGGASLGAASGSRRSNRMLGLSALLPASLKSGGASVSTSQVVTPRGGLGESLLTARSVGGGVMRVDDSTRTNKAERKSELADLWAALGYNADGVALDDVATGADRDKIETPLVHWPGLPKHWVTHWEELLRNIFDTILHLLRDYLLPIKWRSLPWDAAKAIPATHTPHTQSPTAHSPVTHSPYERTPTGVPRPPSGHTPRSPSVCGGVSSPSMCVSGANGSHDTPPRSPSVSASVGVGVSSPSVSRARGKGGSQGTVPAVVSWVLGYRLFKPGTGTALPEEGTAGDVPPAVTGLFEQLGRAGLLQAIEGLFLVELMTDQMYRDHLAAVDASLAADVRFKGGSIGRIDRLRLTAVRIVRDVYANVPQVVVDRQGVQVLRALRKFMSSKLFTPAPQTPSLPHPLLRFTATPPRFEMPSSLALPRAASHNPDHMPLMEILAMRGSQSPRGAKGAKKGWRSESGAADPPISRECQSVTAYCSSSLVAIALELLPLPRLAAARALHDLAPTVGPGTTWVPSPIKTLASALLLIHTWPHTLLLIRTLMRVLRVGGKDAPAAAGKDTSTAASPATTGRATSPTHTLTPSSTHGSPTPKRPVIVLPEKVVTFRARLMAPLCRLLEAWLQETYQLLERYTNKIESLRPCLDTALLHGGADSVLYMLAEGQHYTLVGRARGAAHSAQETPAHHHTWEVVGGWWATAPQAQPCWRPEQTSLLAVRQREIDREYGLSGLGLIPLEELLCVTHQLCSPMLAAQLVTSGVVRALEQATVSVHNRHIVIVSMLRAIAATYLLTTAPTEHEAAEDEDTHDAIQASARSSRSILSTCPSAPRPCSPPSPHAFNATDFARVRSQVAMLTRDMCTLGRSDRLSHEGDGNSETSQPHPTTTTYQGWGGEVDSCTSDDEPTHTHHTLPSPSSNNRADAHPHPHTQTGPKAHTRASDVRGGAAWSDATLAFVKAGGVMSKQARDEESLGLAVPRAGHWLLLASSLMRRAVCSVGVSVAQLAAVRLSSDAVAATAERYTVASPSAHQAATRASVRQRVHELATRVSLTGSETSRNTSDSGVSETNVSLDGSENTPTTRTQPQRRTRRSRRGRKSGETGGGAGAAAAGASEAMAAIAAAAAAQHAAQQAAAKQLLGQQPMGLVQHCRQLLIACKNSNAGEELTSVLQALPSVLEPAAQLRSMLVSLVPMSEPAVQATLQAGVDVAASAIAVVDRHLEGGVRNVGHSPTQALVQRNSSGLATATTPTKHPSSQFTQHSHPSSLLARSTALSKHLGKHREPSQDGDLKLNMNQGNHVSDMGSPRAGNALARDAPHVGTTTRSKPALSVHIPNSSDSPDKGALSTPSAQPLISPSQVAAATSAAAAAAAAAAVGDGACPWLAHASVMSVVDPTDPLWLESERLKQQKTCLDGCLVAWEGRLPGAMVDLPRPEPNSALPALSERPHLMGCCNIYCHNIEQGVSEREVALKRCQRCQRVWWCSDACRQACAPAHKVFCEWSSKML